MNEVEKSRIEEIRKLHGEILDSLKMSLEKAIRIGELLIEEKGKLKHGEFTTWVNNNLPFTDRTARNYMRVCQERDRLKTETVSDLTEAYRLLIEHKPAEPSIDIEPLTQEEIKRFKNIEKDIIKALGKLVRVGIALRIIKEEKLYEYVFQTFEEYCKERWNLTEADIDFYLKLSSKGGERG